MTYDEFIKYCKQNRMNPEGMTVWATDIRMSNGDKLIRDVRAVEGVITHIENIDKTIYYADYAILKVGKRGLTKQVIPFYDNTGYRYNTGTSLNVYLSKEEAVKKAIEQLADIEKYYDHRIKFEQERKARVAKEQAELASLLQEKQLQL